MKVLSLLKDFAVYGQALLCAQFPRLCVSTPVSGPSPELYSYASEIRTNNSASATGQHQYKDCRVNLSRNLLSSYEP